MRGKKVKWTGNRLYIARESNLNLTSLREILEMVKVEFSDKVNKNPLGQEKGLK